MKIVSAVCAASVWVVAGCTSTYVNTPEVSAARAATARAFSDPLIARAYQAKATIRFPAVLTLAAMGEHARQQVRNLDAAGKLEALQRMPHVAAIVPLSTLIFAEGGEAERWNKADLILREAAAKLHADAVFLLKVETNITDGKLFAPLTTVSLGLFPNNRAEVVATALAALVDTKTGYVYGTLERSAGRISHSMSWDDFTRDRTIERASADAMAKLLAGVPDFWRGVVQAHRR